MEIVEADAGFWPELNGPALVRRCRPVHPRTHDYLGALPGFGRSAVLAESGKICPCLVDQVVIPAGEEVGWRFDVVVFVPNAVRIPVLAIAVVPNPVLDPGHV